MISIDNRVGSKELQKHIAPGIKTRLTRLEFGDMSFLGKGPDDSLMAVGIERKAITDLLSSMTTGRLSGHQLVGLLQSYGVVYILVEGSYGVDPKSGLLARFYKKAWHPIRLGTRRFMGREVNNYLNTLTILCGVNVVRTHTQRESGMWISDTYKWWQKPYDKHSAHKSFVVTRPGITLVKPPFMQRVIKEFTGIGWTHSENIANVFPTLLDLAMASQEDLERELVKLPRIGKTLAANMARTIRKEAMGN